MANAATNIAEAPSTGEKPKRKQVNRNMGPRPAYMLVHLPEGVEPSDVRIVSVTRKAEEALAATDADKTLRYLRFTVK